MNSSRPFVLPICVLVFFGASIGGGAQRSGADAQQSAKSAEYRAGVASSKALFLLRTQGRLPAPAIFDFNEDGELDVATFSSSTGEVLLQTRAGAVTVARLRSGPGLTGIVTADFDRDGHHDLAVADGSDNTVTLLFGDGGGGFVRSSLYVVGGNPVALGTGDFDSNGTSDLVVANAQTSDIYVLSGQADGTFFLAQRMDVNGRPVALAVAYLAPNGEPILAVATRAPDQLLAFRFENGTWREAGSAALAAPPVALAAPLEGHRGAEELAIATSREIVLYRVGEEGFDLQLGLSARLASIGKPSQLEILDVNADGRLDVLVAYERSGTFLALRSIEGTFLGQRALSAAEPTPLLTAASITPTLLPPIPGLSLVWPLSPDSRAALGRDYAEYVTDTTYPYHTGLDIGASAGTTVVAAHGGKVRAIPMNSGIDPDNHNMGHVVILDSSYGTNPNGPFTLYAHLQSITVTNGSNVAQGAAIATVGNTGCAPNCNPHLHFEVKDRNVLGDQTDHGPYWGYTPGHPDGYGFHDAVLNLHNVTAVSVRVTVIGDPVNLRAGPGGSGGSAYRAFYSLSAGQIYDAVASAPSSSTPSCSGWYQIIRLDGTRFPDNGGYGQSIPEGWVCKDLVTGGETLTASLSANPNSGTAPLSTTLTATAGGTASGTINFTYWWHCTDPGTSVSQTMLTCGNIPTPAWGSCTSSSYGYKCDGVNDNPKSVAYTYSNAGTYTAKVIIERGSAAPAESRTAVTVSPPPYTLQVNKLGAGSGTVTSSPAGINCGATCSASFASGTQVTLTASPASGSIFGGWSGACSGTGSCVVTMDASKSVTAVFNSVYYPLQVTKSGTGSGTVTSSPAGIDCGATCLASFSSGTQVTLTATPASGSTFAGWSGACSGTGSCIVTMDASKSVTAVFNSVYHTLQVTKSGPGSGTVTSSPAGIDCGATCSASFSSGTQVTLTPTPASGSTFAGWSGACSGTGSCIVTMDASKSVTATFNATVNHTLQVTKSGTGSGTVASSPAGIDCGATCSMSFASGTQVTLTPTPGSNSTFAGWSGACSGTGSCIVTMDASKSVSAAFNLAVAPVTAVTLTPSPASPQGSGVPVTFTAAATGGSGAPEYKFFRHINGAWTVVRGWSTSATWQWNTVGQPAGTYYFTVHARNVGSAAQYEAAKFGSFNLSGPVTGVTLTPNLASTEPVGTSITFTAQGSGGSGSYEYRFYKYVNGAWVIVRNYSATRTWQWNTGSEPAGTHYFTVYARNAGSTAAYDVTKFASYTLTAPVTSVSLTPLPAAPQPVGTTITFTAAAAGGSGNVEYRFYKYVNGAWVIVQNYSTGNQWQWNTAGELPGTHYFTVYARNAGTTASYEAAKFASFTLGP